jgi:hypothetical protein
MKNLLTWTGMVAIAALLCSAVDASAQGAGGARAIGPAASTNVLNIASRDNTCAAEPDANAINPAIVECHAKFAPLPLVPALRSQTTPEQRTAYGDWLLGQLDQPDVCGKGAKVSRQEACAILIYTLDPNRRRIGEPRSANYDGPWTHVVKIYRITPGTDAESSTLLTVSADYSESYVGRDRGELWNLLAEQRAAERCVNVKSKAYVQDNNSGKKMPHSCRRTDAADVRFYPTLLLPRSKAELVLGKDAIRRHFWAPAYYGN